MRRCMRAAGSRHGVVRDIVIVIILTSVTLCGLLFVNLYGRQEPEAITAAEAVAVESDAKGITGISKSSSSPYTVKNTEPENEPGSVSNDNTKSKLMEDLMWNIASKTATSQ